MEEAIELLKSGNPQAALERLKKILISSNSNDKWRIYELIGAAFHDLGNPEGAAEAYFNAAKSDKYLRSQLTHYSNYLFNLHYLSGLDNDTLASEHFLYGDMSSASTSIINDSISYIPNSKLTIGYISSDFLESSSSRFYESLLTEYDNDNFTVKCFTLSPKSDKFTEKIKNAVDKFVDLSNISIEEATQKIIDEHIDILFDLSGHSDGGLTLQILSRKPAKIQICGIGWFDTTGLKTIDYILTDNYLAPIGHEKYFTEKLLRLNAAFAFKPTESMIELSQDNLNNFRLDNSAITFGSFNNFMKITDEYLKCVKKILSQVQNSKFIIQDTTMLPSRKMEMEKRIKKLKLPTERITVRLANDNYLDDYKDIDIILDAFPYNGGMMTAVALYMSVPVISLYGTRHSSRFSADILRLAGLSELITNNIKNYVNLAVDLANDTKKLNELKINIQAHLKKSKLLDTKNFVTELEYFYRKMM